jgi:hypothetical protein
VDGHDALFTASEVEALSPLSADHSVTKSLERGERLVCREELTVQVGNHLLIHHPKERLPLLQPQHTAIESTHLYDSLRHQWGLTTILCKSKNMSCVCFLSLCGKQQTPDTILIKEEEDIGGGMPALG